MPVTVIRAQLNDFSKKVEQRRQTLENTRNTSLRRIRHDIDRIAKKELEFAQKVIETIVPVKISWDESAWERVKDFVPVRVEVTSTDTTSPPKSDLDL
jgi:uncharacterized protein with PIN domain